MKFVRKSAKINKKPSVIREFVDTGMKALIGAIFLKWLLFEAVMMPNSEMEATLFSGDFILVSKLHYGTRTPATPLQIPLTHQKIGNMPAYLDWIQLPMWRLPAFSQLVHNDVITFNYPPENYHPIDQKTPFIGRCVGLAGDELEIKKSEIFINNVKITFVNTIKNTYLLTLKSGIKPDILESFNITDAIPFQGKWILYLTNNQFATLSKSSSYFNIVPLVVPKESTVQSEKIYPHSHYFSWNADNFGQIKIPAKGLKIEATPQNLALYESIILQHENHSNTKIQNDSLFIDNQYVTEYEFRQNYYFVLSDNRQNAMDSRFWGFVPENHIIGKAVLVWFSADSETNKIRWERIGKLL